MTRNSSDWTAPARRRAEMEGEMPAETRFYPCAWFPPRGWTAETRAAFEASERARAAEADEYRRRWLDGEEVDDIRGDIEDRKARALEVSADVGT